jgi:hypothetical protein
MTIVALALAGSGYERADRADGDEPFEADAPFPVRVVPSALVRGAPTDDA